MRPAKYKYIAFVLIFSLFHMMPAIAVNENKPAKVNKSITKNVNIPSTPGSNFSGEAGGDGFNTAHANGHVYNVFHHNEVVEVNCHDEINSELCTYNGITWPVVVTESVGTSMYSNAFINPAGTRLFVWAIEAVESAGIQCMELSDGSDCGYQVLSNVLVDGDVETVVVGALGDEYVNWGSGARINNRIFTSFVQPDGQTWLACFDLKKEESCTETAYQTEMFAEGFDITTIFGTPNSIAYGTKVYTDYSHPPFDPETFEPVDAEMYVDCWDYETSASCDGLWPVVDSTTSSWMPVLNTSGKVVSLCPIGIDAICIDAETGATVDTPEHMLQYQTESLGFGVFIGNSLIFGKRVISIMSEIATEGNSISNVSCTDYSSATPTPCGNIELPHTSLLYALDKDPLRPTCVWVNSDETDTNEQITNFDILTMEQGCSGSLRTSLVQLSTKAEGCDIASWDSVKITSPSSWDSATLTVKDADGNVLPGGNAINIQRVDRVVSLANVDFADEQSPLFDFDVQGADLSNGLDVQFKWHTSTPQICKGLKATSKTKFTGTTGNLELGKSLRISGKTTPNACTNNLLFSLDRNPITGVVEPFAIDAGNHETSNWKPGKYRITTTHPADDYCKASSSNESVNLIAKIKGKQSISASGWYLNDGVKESFKVKMKSKTQNKGNVLIVKLSGIANWEIANEWQFKANLKGNMRFVGGTLKSGANVVTETTCPKFVESGAHISKPSCFLISAVGKLRKWDPISSAWINPQEVQFVIELYNGGSGTKKIKGIARNFDFNDYASFNLFADIPEFLVPSTVPVKLKSPTGKGNVKSQTK